ncbi:MAG: hypothetical protein AB7P22_17365 [Vicinamibacterales bacterium]
MSAWFDAIKPLANLLTPGSALGELLGILLIGREAQVLLRALLPLKGFLGSTASGHCDAKSSLGDEGAGSGSRNQPSQIRDRRAHSVRLHPRG